MSNIGIMPVGHKIILREKDVDEKTKGGIILPDETKEANKNAQTRGVIVAIGSTAFNYDDIPAQARPRVGDEVYYARYAGTIIKNDQQDEYRMVNDQDITAIIR